MHSGFLDNVRPGYEIMADRRFSIRDLLLERRAKLVILPFLQKSVTGPKLGGCCKMTL